jgi:hypothetical protein
VADGDYGVPLLDLRAQHATIRNEVVSAILSVIDEQAFILGEPVRVLERGTAERYPDILTYFAANSIGAPFGSPNGALDAPYWRPGRGAATSLAPGRR